MSKPSVVVLVVEDNALIRIGVLDLVRDAGFEALEAENADEAIALLDSRSDISLVFTDVRMPGTMDGIKLAAHIRERWPPVHLMVASGHGIAEGRVLPEGARFFSKPYDGNTLLATMVSMLGPTKVGQPVLHTRH
jgi:two-component system, response regulator PdtaR